VTFYACLIGFWNISNVSFWPGHFGYFWWLCGHAGWQVLLLASGSLLVLLSDHCCKTYHLKTRGIDWRQTDGQTPASLDGPFGGEVINPNVGTFSAALDSRHGRNHHLLQTCWYWHRPQLCIPRAMHLLGLSICLSVRLSICLSKHGPIAAAHQRWVCCCEPSGQEILIYCCTAGGPAVSRSRVVAAACGGRMWTVPRCQHT